MAWGTLTIGSLVLKETDILEDVTNANTGVRSVRIAGAETNPGRVPDEQFIEAVQQDIMGLLDRIMPVTFERKSSYNGYYRATDTNTTYEKWAEGPGQVRWSLSLDYLGPDNALDLESRLAGVMRNGQSGELWHAPAGGHTAYFAGAVAPSKLVRTTEDGPIAVYRTIPAGVNPLWSCPVSGYGTGRSRFLLGGLERVGERFPCGITGWELSNGLVRVKPTPGTTSTLLVGVYDGTAWRERDWDVRVAGDSLKPLDHWQSVVVLRNDPECAIVRIVAAQPSNGNRVLLDLTLRRGARFVEGYVQRVTAGELVATPDIAEPTTDVGLYVVSNGVDANGILWTAGSSKPYSTDPNGGLLINSATTMDFYIGAVIPVTALVRSTFEGGSVAPWSPVGATVSVSSSGGAYEGNSFARAVAAGGTDLQLATAPLVGGVVAGKSYNFILGVRSSTAISAANLLMVVDWYSSSNAFVSTTNANGPAITADTWTKLSSAHVAPATAAKVSIRIKEFAAAVTAGQLLDVDNVLLLESAGSGEVAADLWAQYIGTMAEKVGVVRR